MKKVDSIFLKHIVDAISDIQESVEGLTRESFESDKDVRDATLRRLEVIGEAVKNLSEETKSKYKKVEWKKIAGTRDVIIHAYFNVDWDLVWDIVIEDIVKLKAYVKEILKDER